MITFSKLSKWKGKIAFQIGILILIINLLTLTICFYFQNTNIQSILLKKSAQESQNSFEQAEYNIENFCDQIDMISRKLATASELSVINRDRTISEREKIISTRNVVDLFQKEKNNCSYIRNISFYGTNGVMISVENNANYTVFDKEKVDTFFESSLGQMIHNSNMLLQWFGGYTSADFRDKETDLNKEELSENYYVSAVRKTLATSGYLVINVDMKEFFLVFGAQDNQKDEVIYMIDCEGRIIMAREREDIGTYRQVMGIDEENSKPRKYTEARKKGEVQIYVYLLSNMNTFLVSERAVEGVTSDSKYMRNVLLITCLTSIFVSFLISQYVIARKLRPLQGMVNGIKQVGKGELGCVLAKGPKNEIGFLTEQFNRMSLELKEMFDKNLKIEEEKSRLEMQALRSQINPHLIYNTMNNIKWMALIKNERNIAESITLLADFLEPIFKNRSNLCTVKEELDYMKNYIYIMNLRVAGKYTLEYEIPDKYMNCILLRFLLQPIVENAIIHGIADNDYGIIKISMWDEGKDGFIRVEDDGIGIPVEILEELKKKLERGELNQEDGDGVGILNVNRRIKVQYGETYGLCINNLATSGTEVILKIPLKQKM